MLGVLFLAVTSFGFATAFNFTDCTTDKCNALLTVRHLDISPDVIVFPGQIQLSAYITINQQIDHLFVDTVIEKQTLWSWTKIPCIGSTKLLGSCQNIDLETIFDNMRNGSYGIFNGFGLHVILLKALGYKAQFPISPRDVIISDETVTFQDKPSSLRLLSTGKYRVTVFVKDDPTDPDNRGCIQFQFEVAQKSDPNQIG